MKKLLCLLLVFLLLCPALAAADGDAYHPGDTFEAVFTVTDNPQGAEIIMAQLEYDPFVFQPLPSQGLYQNTGVIFSGSSMAVSFQISPYAPSGTYEIGMTVLDAANEKSSGLPVTIQSVRVTVAEDKPAAPETDFDYKIEDGKAKVTKYKGPGGEVVIPEMLGGKPVGEIGKFAFSGCIGLTSVTIPNSVTSIGNYAFSVCSSLTSVTIPNSVTSIGCSAFYGCRSLTSVTIPNSVMIIRYMAFYGCINLTSVTIPDNVTRVESHAFSDCRSLTSVTIPNNVTSIGEGAFLNCSSLTSVTIPNSVTRIGDRAFYGCNSLSSVTIPDSVKSIESYVFNGCSNLTSVSIPNSVTSIELYAFCDCRSLTSVTIPDSVTYIGSGAFYGCSKKLVITVTKNSYAQQYCKDNKLKYKTAK